MSSSRSRTDSDSSSGSERHSRRRSRSPITKRLSKRRSPDTTLSDFYKQRFGSHSPEEYRNLRLSQFDERINGKDIRELLDKELEKKYGPYEIKVIRNPEDDNQKLAYVNFEKQDAAKKIRRILLPQLQRIFGRNLYVDPAGVVRDQEGNYVRDRCPTYNSASATSRRDQSPRRYNRRSSPSMPRKRRESNASEWRSLKKDDAHATRTLFVGNLALDIREADLRKVFEKYGTIDDVDIKTPADAKACYAFILYQDVEQAMDAKANEHDEPIRTGDPRCKIGYGKSQPSNRLWVGKLGDWTAPSDLEKQFRRFGEIDFVDYRSGDTFGYVRFVDLPAATEACREMKNYPLGGKDRPILVDFANDDPRSRKRRRSSSSSPDRDQSRSPKGQRRGPHTPPDSPIASSRSSSATPSPTPQDDQVVSVSAHEAISRSPSPEKTFNTVAELEEEVASTWKGLVQLKRRDYLMKLFRLTGSEHLLQSTLRDNHGASLRPTIAQRLSLSSAFHSRLENLTPKDYTLMVGAAGNEENSLQPLCVYLNTKTVIGIVQLNGVTGYIVPPGDVAEETLDRFSPMHVPLVREGMNNVVFLLIKNL
ncbi:hypothetical protein QR680_015069 [Steinernema hermaphroditum]|uniref:RNA-binding protein 15B n=1 Tax=Steinernema hermaphroditum TaxID=289476 RepID=A0AA39IB10_9BILA|nr:hypothetical protein QR680_015069 [Steinernema hermaphroditum]